MSEELLNLEFDILSKKIGEVVSCKVWQIGKKGAIEEATYTGVLNGVVPFDIINLDNHVIPFVGTTQAIEEISLAGTDRTLYINPKVKGYQGYYERDFTGLIAAQQEILGRSVKLEEIEAKLNSGKRK